MKVKFRVAVSLPFYFLALALVALCNFVGGTTFVIVPQRRTIPKEWLE
jgi:hypothetical protein